MKILEVLIAPAFILLMISSLAGCHYNQNLEELQPVDTATVKFSTDIIPIFNTGCNVAYCHDGTQPPNLLPAIAYDELISGNWVNVNDPPGSQLYLWMIGQESTPMPPSGADTAYNAKVLAWIQQGALNN